jgi:hypothetical protein
MRRKRCEEAVSQQYTREKRPKTGKRKQADARTVTVTISPLADTGNPSTYDTDIRWTQKEEREVVIKPLC